MKKLIVFFFALLAVVSVSTDRAEARKPGKVKVGSHMADAELFGIDGNPHRLTDYKGRYILLDFWSLGCGYCLSEMPDIRAVAEEYSGVLNVVGVNIDTEEQWRYATVKIGALFSWTNLSTLGDKAIIELYSGKKAYTIPYHVLISPDGRVLKKWEGAREGVLRKYVDQYVK